MSVRNTLLIYTFYIQLYNIIYHTTVIFHNNQTVQVYATFYLSWHGDIIKNG